MSQVYHINNEARSLPCKDTTDSCPFKKNPHGKMSYTNAVAEVIAHEKDRKRKEKQKARRRHHRDQQRKHNRNPHRTPGEEERDNDALRPNDPKERGPDDDVQRAEEDLENLHDKARPL